MSNTEAQIIALQQHHNELAGNVRTMQAELSVCNSRMKTRLPYDEYRRLVAKRVGFTEKIASLQTDMSDIKQRIRELSLQKEQERAAIAAESEAPELILRLVALREEYLSFAGDKTRVASMRAMAAEFVRRIDNALGKVK